MRGSLRCRGYRHFMLDVSGDSIYHLEIVDDLSFVFLNLDFVL